MSVEMLWWIYIGGYVLMWRYVVGALLNDLTSGHRFRVDGGDIVMSMVFGSFVTLGWPVILVGRAGYVLALKFAPSSDAITTLFPAPRKVESRTDKKERKEREARETLQASRRAIHAREDELGMERSKF